MSSEGREFAVAKFKFDARKSTELSFTPGDVIVLSPGEPAPGWLRGHLLRDDALSPPPADGLFPANYVDRSGIGKETFVLAVALYDFAGRTERELTIHAGDSITLVNPDYQSTYITAQFNGRRGLVPTDYVELAEVCDEGEEEEEDYSDEEEEEEKEKEEDIPPPLPTRDTSIPRDTSVVRKLNVIRTLRRGTMEHLAALANDGSGDDIPPPLPVPESDKPPRPAPRSFRVTAPPAQMTSGKYVQDSADSQVDIPPPPVPAPPMVGSQTRGSAAETNTRTQKRLSMPPVASNTDLFSLMMAEENAARAEREAGDAAAKEMLSDSSDATIASFSKAARRPNLSAPVHAPKNEPVKIDAATDAKLAAFANMRITPIQSREEAAGDIPPPASQSAATLAPPSTSDSAGKLGRRGKRLSMLLPTDMASHFQQKLQEEAKIAAPGGAGGLSAPSGAELDDSFLFEEADNPDIIQFNSSGALTGATFVKMMAYLTAPSSKTETQRLNNIKSFVECFRMFCTPEQFFEKVRMRFLTVSDGSAIVQKNCIEMLLAWTQCAYSVDLAPNPQLLENVQSFLDSVAKACDNMSPVVCQAARHVEQVNKLLGQPVVLPEESVLLAEQYSHEPVPHAAAFLKASATDIAQQLSLVQHHMLMKVCPVELVRDVWMAESADSLAPNLTAHIDFCNQKTLWLQEAIVSAKKDSERKKVISHIVDCAEQCLACNNFYGMMIFLSAVQSRSVKPLDKLFSSKSLEKLERVILPLVANDCREIRSVQEIRSPCVPYVDTWLADMAELNRNTPDYLPDTHLISWSKIQVLGVSLRRLQNFQHGSAYTYPPKRHIIGLIHAMKPTLKEEQVFALAQDLLPKKKKK